MLEEFLTLLVQVLRDRLAIMGLRRELNRLKLRHYDLVVDNLHGLRRALETQQRAVDELNRQIVEREGQIAKLREEYSSLEARLVSTGNTLVQEERLALFRRLQAIATQFPTLRAALADGADISARDIVELLKPLDEALRDLGFEMIGEAGAEVPYDPRRHRLVGRGAKSGTIEMRVRIRYVGYTYGEDIVCKAEVTLAQQSEAIS